MKSRQNIFLASGSPRRKKLLRSLIGNRFKVVKHEHLEEKVEELSPSALAKHHAEAKALSAGKKIRSGIVIGADTIVVCKRRILGKPRTAKKAEEMLRLINGNTVVVMTAVCVLHIEKRKRETFVEKTKVKIKKLGEKEILNYIKTKEPLDKAGAFAIQGKGKFLIEEIKGGYNNVVGLPVERLRKALKSLNPFPIGENNIDDDFRAPFPFQGKGKKDFCSPEKGSSPERTK